MPSFRKELWFMGVGVIVLVGLGALLARTTRYPLPAYPIITASNIKSLVTSSPPRCRTSQLALQVAQRNGIAGGSIVLKQLHNISVQSCSLQGAPQLHTFVTAHPSAPLPFRQEIAYSSRPAPAVVITPGGWASFYEIITAHHYDSLLKTFSITSQWRLPGATHPITVETTSGGDRVVSLFISDVYPGKYPANTPGIQWSSNSGQPPTHPPLPAHRQKVPGATSYGSL